MPHPISEKVLQEILRAFAWEEASLPSEDALRELAAATDHTHEAAAKAIHGKRCQIMSQNSGCEQER
jgi:hypothetical protein